MPTVRATRLSWRRSDISASPAPGYCTLTATSRPSAQRPRCTWPIEAAAAGSSSNSTSCERQPVPSSLAEHVVHGGAGIGGAESWSLVELRAVGRRQLLGERRLEDGQRLAHLHRAALEVAERLEELLGGALLHLGHHGLGGGAAEPPAHADRACGRRSPGGAPPAARCGASARRGSSVMPGSRCERWREQVRGCSCPHCVRRSTAGAAQPGGAAKRTGQSQLQPHPGWRSQACVSSAAGPACRVTVVDQVEGRPPSTYATRSRAAQADRQRGQQRVDRLGRAVGPVARAGGGVLPDQQRPGRVGVGVVRVDAAQAGGRAGHHERADDRAALGEPDDEVRRPGAGPARRRSSRSGSPTPTQHAAVGRRAAPVRGAARPLASSATRSRRHAGPAGCPKARDSVRHRSPCPAQRRAPRGPAVRASAAPRRGGQGVAAERRGPAPARRAAGRARRARRGWRRRASSVTVGRDGEQPQRVADRR